jgi:hypothetical protein
MSFNKVFQAGSKAVVMNEAMKWLDTQQAEAQRRGSSIYHRSPSIGTPRFDGYDKDHNEVWTLTISLLNK